jgi:hypothetical protein
VECVFYYSVYHYVCPLRRCALKVGKREARWGVTTARSGDGIARAGRGAGIGIGIGTGTAAPDARAAPNGTESATDARRALQNRSTLPTPRPRAHEYSNACASRLPRARPYPRAHARSGPSSAVERSLCPRQAKPAGCPSGFPHSDANIRLRTLARQDIDDGAGDRASAAGSTVYPLCKYTDAT